MSKWIEIRFRVPHHEPESSGFVHRVRNFGEHLVWPLREEGLGTLSMEDADRAIESLRIVRIRSRALRRAIAFIKQELLKHGFSGEATVVSGGEDES